MLQTCRPLLFGLALCLGMILSTPSSGDLNLPVATVNAAAPVATRADTWDSIKATYR